MQAAKTLLGIVLFALLVSACAPQKTLLDRVEHTPNELIYNDLFGSNFTSSSVTVLGISVGMTEADITSKLGPADLNDEYNFGGIKNLGYGKSLGLNDTGVLYHLENGIVTRITISEGMNSILPEKNRITGDVGQVYGVFGIPDRQYSYPIADSSGSYYGGRFFVYNKQGLEIYLNKYGWYQYSFVYPNRKLPSTSVSNVTGDANSVVQAKLPTLMTDTTTLCDQGATYGRDPSSNECKSFDNSCLIPDYWVEVKSCDANATVIGAPAYQ